MKRHFSSALGIESFPSHIITLHACSFFWCSPTKQISIPHSSCVCVSSNNIAYQAFIHFLPSVPVPFSFRQQVSPSVPAHCSFFRNKNEKEKKKQQAVCRCTHQCGCGHGSVQTPHTRKQQVTFSEIVGSDKGFPSLFTHSRHS